MSWNSGAKATFGYDESEVIGKPYSVIFTEEDIASGRPESELKTSREYGKASVDGWHVRKDGSRFWCTDTVQKIVDEDGAVTGFTKIVRDSTERFMASEELRESEEFLRVLVEGVTEYGIFSIDPEGNIRLWNSGAERIFGYRESDVLGKHFSLIYPPDAIASGVPAAEIVEAKRSGHVLDEGWHVRKNGERFYASGQTTQLKAGPDGQSRGFVKITHDITQHKETEEKLRRQAAFDELTQLANRRSFTEHLRRAIALVKRNPARHFAVIFLDLDHFKNVNDSLGHVTADTLLVSVARTLETCVRPEDVVARLGGDEFTILLTEIRDVSDARCVAARIHAALAAPVLLDNVEVFTSASMGIAIGSSTYDRPEAILRDADTAMYEAKARGRSQEVVFDDKMHARAVDLLALHMDLRRAFARREFFLEYQPIVRLADRHLVGFEALVRWNHPKRGTVFPSEFIAEAENIGLLTDIDSWVLAEACRQLRAWQIASNDPTLTVSVNLSGRHFSNDALVEKIKTALATNQLDPQSLKIEITERALMDNVETTAATVARIDALGVELYIDDFGTGYSSLSYLTRLPLKLLKVDRTFVGNVITDPRSGEIARTIVTLAHSLGLSALAEGIETEKQLLALEKLGCEFGQGFWFSKAVVPEHAQTLIGKNLPA